MDGVTYLDHIKKRLSQGGFGILTSKLKISTILSVIVEGSRLKIVTNDTAIVMSTDNLLVPPVVGGFLIYTEDYSVGPFWILPDGRSIILTEDAVRRTLNTVH